jgi:hemoglobin/transferrin/lactoferrin receptor protein
MEKQVIRSASITLFSILILGHVSAQEINNLETINVFSEKNILNINDSEGGETLETQAIDETIPSSMDDILKLSPGATTVGGPRSSAEGIQVRGLTTKKLYVYIDGAKQSFSADHSSSAMLAIDPENIKTVDIHKSSASYSQGGSLGGGLIFTTKDASDFLEPGEKWGSSYKVGYQQSNHEESQSFKTYGRFDNYQALFSINRRKAEDLILAKDQILPNSSYEDTSLLTKLSYKINSSDTFKISHERFMREDASPLNPTLNPPDDMTELNSITEISRQATNIEYKSNPKSNRFINMKTNLYSTSHEASKTRESDQRRDDRVVKTSGGTINNRAIVTTLNKQEIYLDMGVEYIQDELSGDREGKNVAVYPSGVSKEQSAFTQVQFYPHRRLMLSPGVRFQTYEINSDNSEHKTKKANALSKKISSTLSITDWAEIYANASEGFNAPKVQDVYVDGLHYRGDDFFILDNFFTPNHELNPETSRTLDLGFKVEHGLFSNDDLISIKFNQYWTEAKDYIYYEKIDRAIFDEEYGTTQYINIPDVKINGRELEVEYLYDRFESKLTYTQTRGRNITKSIYIADMPADQYTFNVKYNLEDNGIVFGYLGILTNDQDRVNPQTEERTDPTPGYLTHNVFFTKKFLSGDFKGFEISTRIDNLTNRDYRKHASNIKEVGMDYKLGFQYKINNF